jgi:hypothetical protein
MVGGSLGYGRTARGVQPALQPGYGEPGTRVECVAIAPETPRWPGRPAHADGAPHVSHDATHDAPHDMNAVVSLEELERSWQRIDALIAVRNWLNGAILLLLVLLRHWGYRDLAWALWTNLVWTSGAILAASIVMQLAGIDRSGHRIGSWLQLVMGTVGVVIGSSILGLLLSVFAAHDPARLLGPNGFINADTLEVLRHTTVRYAPILLLAVVDLVFAVRMSRQARVSPASYLGDHVVKMIGALVVGGLVGIALARLFSTRMAEIGLGVFLLIWFIFPWRIFARDTIQDQRAEGRPALYAGRRLPLMFTERAGPAVVAITLVLALMFGACGLGLLNFGLRQFGTHGVALQPAILVLMSLPVCGVFVFLALVSFTLAASVKRVTVTAEGVAVSERGWVMADDRSWRGRLAATFRSSHWRAAPGDYTRIEQQLQPHRSSDGPDYDEHRLVLKHRGDALRDVVLYRAFHARHIDTVKTYYADLLRVAAC